MIKIWIDDIRNPPDDKWFICRTSKDAIDVLSDMQSLELQIDEISFDHDLGGDDTTRSVVLWMIENRYFPVSAYVHSMNPVGYSWIIEMIDRYFEST